MVTERAEFPWLIRLRRRSQGRTQEHLARSAGVTKSALSRYESGDTRVLGDATLRTLCADLGLEVPLWLAQTVPGDEPTGPASGDGSGVSLTRYHCPTPFCRMNPWFAVPGWLHFTPRFVESVADGEVVCQYCGATMQSACGQCGAALGQHGVCPACGEDYVRRLTVAAATQTLELNAAAERPAASAVGKLPFWPPLRRDPGAGDARAAGDAAERARDESGRRP
jgi:DNA-binding XRE family transcriptional regulator